MEKSKRQKSIILLSLFVSFIILCVLVFNVLPKILSDHYLAEQNILIASVSTTTESVSVVFTPSYISSPDSIKGLYMTSWVAGTPSLRNKVVKLVDQTEINSVVIDIKDYSGKIVFPVTDSTLKSYGSVDVRVGDMQDFIESLHQKGVYVIGRIAVFQDAYFVKFRPDLAVKNKAGTATWKDYKGISWIDPASREYWDYIILLSKEARKIGFDEINFDYIRFPSDGNMKDVSYEWSSTTTKNIVMKDFFQYLHEGLADSGLKISVDLFGMTTTAQDDMGIGQTLESALPYFDYIDPMVYPSHYPKTFMGYKNPEQYPYEVVKYAMQSAVTRTEAFASTTRQDLVVYKNKLRPWLQDFGLSMDYSQMEVQAQIKATNDNGLSSWLLWSPGNKYTVSALNNN